jgi:hypothetical protein
MNDYAPMHLSNIHSPSAGISGGEKRKELLKIQERRCSIAALDEWKACPDFPIMLENLFGYEKKFPYLPLVHNPFTYVSSITRDE